MAIAVMTERRQSEFDRRSIPRGGRRQGDTLALDRALESMARRFGALMPDQRPTVLVVDDFADGRDIMREYLCFCGFRVTTAKHGEEALEKARAALPEVVLLDLVLPVMDGFDVITGLKQSEQTKHIKVVVFTANVLNDVRSRVTDAGATFIPKPCDPRIVALQVASLAIAQSG
jgi:CheY-like chemotaxis protein